MNATRSLLQQRSLSALNTKPSFASDKIIITFPILVYDNMTSGNTILNPKREHARW